MASQNEILEYIMKTPGNTNPAVLKSIVSNSTRYVIQFDWDHEQFPTSSQAMLELIQNGSLELTANLSFNEALTKANGDRIVGLLFMEKDQQTVLNDVIFEEIFYPWRTAGTTNVNTYRSHTFIMENGDMAIPIYIEFIAQEDQAFIKIDNDYTVTKTDD